nr:MAG TPA: hypothetical protein [Caudoviricetes sp.]
MCIVVRIGGCEILNLFYLHLLFNIEKIMFN